MVRKTILSLFLLFGCSSWIGDEWDSGAQKSEDYQKERMEEITEDVQDQFPTPTPGTERDQPF